MEIHMKELEKKDYKQVIQFAITGMHFNLYLQNRFLLNLYGKYFWYDELNRATQVIAIYVKTELAGVLLADMKNEEKKYKSFGKTMYIKLFDFLQNLFFKGGADIYNEANKEMFNEYRKKNNPDGQIVFLASNPFLKEKGIGSMLLKELERREKGKQIYLYTDEACTYQFYEHRGFSRSGEKNVILKFGSRKVPLKCFLYSKKLSV